jgi:hypothetical protein
VRLVAANGARSWSAIAVAVSLLMTFFDDLW